MPPRKRAATNKKDTVPKKKKAVHTATSSAPSNDGAIINLAQCTAEDSTGRASEQQSSVIGESDAHHEETVSMQLPKGEKERDNYQRFIVLFIDVGRESLLKVFDYIDKRNPGKVIFPISMKSPIGQEIQNKFYKNQYVTILAAKSPAEFDISTLLKLLSCKVFSNEIPPVLIPNLVRLRSIRNTVVAHSTTARLSDADFGKNVEEFAICLKRIIHEVDPESENRLANTIEDYKKQTIDAEKFRKYCLSLKKQIDDLSQKLSDCTKLCKNAPTPFLRYVELLLNGGNLILFGYLCKLLEKSNVSLERLLSENHALLLRELPEWMMQQLYSGSDEQIQVNTDTNSWDISVLTTLIETIFGREVEELVLKAIRLIRKARKEYALAALYAITNDDRFSRKREDLMRSLTTLALSTGEESGYKLDSLIEKYRSSSEMSADSNEYFATLKSHGSDIRSIGDLHKETLDELKDELGIAVNVNENLELEIMLQIVCEDSSKQTEAESLLYKFLKSILANPDNQPEGPDLPEVRKPIEKINSIPKVQLTCVQRSCLLLTVECQSNGALLSLINFLEGPKFRHQLGCISNELKDLFDDVFILDGHLTLESLQNTLRRNDTKKLQDKTDMIYVREQERYPERESPKIKIPLKSWKRQGSESDLRNLNIELKTVKKHMSELQHENSTLQMKNKEFTRSLRIAEREIAALRQERVESKPFEEKQNSKQLTTRLNDLEKVNTLLANQKKELEEVKRRITYRFNALLDESQRRKEKEHEEMNRRVSNQLNELRSENSSLTCQADDLRTRNSILSNQISKLEENELHLTNQLSRTETRKAERKQLVALERLGKQKAELEHVLENLETRYSLFEQQSSQRENALLTRLAEAEDAALKAVKQLPSRQYSRKLKVQKQQQKKDLIRLLERSEREREEMERLIHETRVENTELSTKCAEMKIRMSEAEEEYKERSVNTLSREYVFKQEINDLKNDLATEMHLRNEYFHRNTELSEEIRALRERLDAIKRGHTSDIQQLEGDINRVEQRCSKSRVNHLRGPNSKKAWPHNDLKRSSRPSLKPAHDVKVHLRTSPTLSLTKRTNVLKVF